jgi:hypothetical protein
MSKLNTIPFKSSVVPKGPAGTSFARFSSAKQTNAQMSALQGRGGGSKKGHAGTVAGLRGGKPRASTSAVSTPKGPTRVFPSVNLARARTTAAAKPAVRRSLLNRVVGGARKAFGG